MCNLYRMNQSRTEVADFFSAIGADMRVAPGNSPAEIYPGYPGLVLADRRIQQMNWGFPLARKGAKGQPLKPKPVNNARSDKLGSPFWSASFKSRRCLIPVSEFAEAEGEKGAKTRTWFTLPDTPLFAIAGLWRDTAEWGPAYTMVITGANAQMRSVHHRMPVIIPPENWQQYLGDDPQAAFDLCQPYAGDMIMTRTDVPWAGHR
ncbi:SOS response-associated peptidase [Alteraurantiacibacter aestuarii]|uniref:Abasic site processing protein n=1 Tax=Alteraurantiacibacter aestuarii TaxID=650004 RepID=A0A844ZKN7_9SPHN|nr:SOS response-associated peptidase family protein [Alteraurantiacibacter aestuarii]MXO89001.1 hypothetical protein [Alteraurantiacibacter aestuarii]